MLFGRYSFVLQRRPARTCPSGRNPNYETGLSLAGTAPAPSVLPVDDSPVACGEALHSSVELQWMVRCGRPNVVSQQLNECGVVGRPAPEQLESPQGLPPTCLEQSVCCLKIVVSVRQWQAIDG